jgi:hypothetical protein
MAKNVKDLLSFAVDTYNHLGGRNYRSNEWTPVMTGMSGGPDITAWYQKHGTGCNFIIELDGTHTMSTANSTLPITPSMSSVAFVNNYTDNEFIGTATIDVSGGNIKFPDYSVTDKKVVICGFIRVEGI